MTIQALLFNNSRNKTCIIIRTFTIVETTPLLANGYCAKPSMEQYHSKYAVDATRQTSKLIF